MIALPYVDRDMIRFFQPNVSSEHLETLRGGVSFPEPVAIPDPLMRSYVVLDGTHRSYLEMVEREKEGIGLEVCLTLNEVLEYGSECGVCGRVRYEVEQFMRKAPEDERYINKFPMVGDLYVL